MDFPTNFLFRLSIHLLVCFTNNLIELNTIGDSKRFECPIRFPQLTACMLIWQQERKKKPIIITRRQTNGGNGTMGAQLQRVFPAIAVDQL